MASLESYDMVVIGSGPGGQRAAIQAAKLGKKVVIVEKEKIGGSCLHSGTIPSKTLREAALAGHGRYADPFQFAMDRTREVIAQETLVVTEQLRRNNVGIIAGTASFVGPQELEVASTRGTQRLKARFIILATGTRPFRPATIPFNDETVLDSDTILRIRTKPKSLAVLGAGVIGSEYASIFACLGIRVTLVDQRPTLMSWMDQEIASALQAHFEANPNMELCLGVQRTEVQALPAKARLILDGRERDFDAVLCCMGRGGNTEGLRLEKASLTANERGLIPVNEFYQTAVPHIYAVGDVIGSPGLASASAEQGRLAAAHAFGFRGGRFPDSFPYGIYTIPEISTVGLQESDLIAKSIPYVVGRAKYTELARGKILGDDFGFLKLLFHVQSQQLIGVQIIGTGATELIHIGQAAFMLGGGIDFFVNNVFNYPTLAEAYKVAAYHAYNQIKSLASKPSK
jgi:NAD(P) transhydrogenase